MRRKALRGARAAGVLWAVLLCAAAPQAWADGCYMPERAYKKLPSIPVQRALVVHRDGEERLIIESALDGEGQSFGWIIPVPATPTAFEEVSPSLLATLSVRLQPKITHDVWDGEAVGVLAVCAFFVLVLAVAVLWGGSFCGCGVALLVVLIAISELMGPVSGRELYPRAVSPAFVEATAVVGSHDITVLQAEDAGTLDAWLGENGFAPLPSQGRAIVTDYIADGWRFVAARLRKEGEGVCVPHPISIQFPTEDPVYPMKLTALAGSELYLELFVIAGQRMEPVGAPLATDICNSDTYKTHGSPGSRGESLPRYSCDTYYWREIGHPAALDVMWNGCVVTKLSGSLRPEQMADDIHLNSSSSGPYRRHKYTRQGARQMAVSVALGLWCVVVVVGLIRAQQWPRCHRTGRRWILVAAASGVVAGAVLFCGVYLLVPKLEEAALVYPSYFGMFHATFLATATVADTPESERSTLAQAEALLAEYLADSDVLNPFTGAKMKVEDSPGNVEIIESDDGLMLVGYDEGGFRVGHLSLDEFWSRPSEEEE